MNLYVSRNGQTFGPYTIDQANSFLASKQLLATDFALVEGTAEWKALPDVLATIGIESLKSISANPPPVIQVERQQTNSIPS